eukprot:12838164-Prorocentrum_lima.AAC.1
MHRYDAVAAILSEMGVASVTLLTNNPFKIASLRQLGVTVEDTMPLWADAAPPMCAGYLRAK